jgi:hypothetical protein
VRTKVCKCGSVIPNLVTIDGRVRNLSNRKFCLECSPFGRHNTRDLTKPVSDRNIRFWKYQAQERSQRKAQLVAARGGSCCLCGYDRCIAALEFHHRDPAQKAFELSKTNLLRRWEIVLAEAQKCDLLCANCHRELEERLRLREDEPNEGNV